MGQCYPQRNPPPLPGLPPTREQQQARRLAEAGAKGIERIKAALEPPKPIRRTEAGVKSVGPSPSELRGPVYVVDLSGIKFEDGRKTRTVVDFGKK